MCPGTKDTVNVSSSCEFGRSGRSTASGLMFESDKHDNDRASRNRHASFQDAVPTDGIVETFPGILNTRHL